MRTTSLPIATALLAATVVAVVVLASQHAARQSSAAASVAGAPAEFRVVTSDDLEHVPPTYPTITPEDYEREILVHNLNAWGRQGWELCLFDKSAMVLRSDAPRTAWEYAAVPVREPFAEDKPKAAAALGESLKSLDKDGWIPCGLDEKTLLVKRPAPSTDATKPPK